MKALLVLSLQQVKELVALGVANKIKHTKKRVYISYGSTNQLILNKLGIKRENYYNGYIDDFELKSNKNREDIIILNDNKKNFLKTISKDDIIIKGANALSFENGKYIAGVAVASPEGGTYGSVVLRASCVGAEVIIPVSHEKLVPKLLANRYTQSSFDITMGLSVALFKLDYGRVYTEIDAFKELFGLEAEIYLSAGVDSLIGALTFIVDGDKKDILRLQKELDL